jgi:hypothetical protein
MRADRLRSLQSLRTEARQQTPRWNFDVLSSDPCFRQNSLYALDVTTCSATIASNLRTLQSRARALAVVSSQQTGTDEQPFLLDNGCMAIRENTV